MSRLGLFIVSAVVITVVILANTLYIVTDRETAIKLRFGEIIDSSIEPGLHFKVPILHTIKKFDERVLTLDNLPQPYFTGYFFNFIQNNEIFLFQLVQVN